jgi:glycosyltransferase involved in cell wall biosynthesis
MITLSITNYNRTDLLIKSFIDVLPDRRITEVVIVDDASDLEKWNLVKALISDLRSTHAGAEKIKLFRNLTNQGVYRNKRISVQYATNPWVIVFDSDNVIGPDYLDALEKEVLYNGGVNHAIAYAPDFAKPMFNYTHFSGSLISRVNVASFMRRKQFDCLINTMNFFVNRDEYLANFDPDTEPVAADSAYFNLMWLRRGNKMFVVPKMQYEHLIHDGSHYVQNIASSNEFHAYVMDELKSMR